ncbi:MAG: hypothetical protein ACYCOU_02585 [Sulfobacillus sp.]
MSLIATGGYGKIYYPPKSCGDNQFCEDCISKEVSIKEGEKELINNRIIDQLDPSNRWHLPIIHSCVIDDKILLYMKKASMDLRQLHLDEEYVEKYLYALAPIFSAVETLNINGYLDMDIHPRNIVIMNEKFYLIDFGTLTDLNNFQYPFPDYKHAVPNLGPEMMCFNVPPERWEQELDTYEEYSHPLIWNGIKSQKLSLTQFCESPGDRISYLRSVGESWSLGCILSTVYNIFIEKYPNLEDEMKSLLLAMCDPNIFTRISITEANKRFKSLIKKLGQGCVVLATKQPFITHMEWNKRNDGLIVLFILALDLGFIEIETYPIYISFKAKVSGKPSSFLLSGILNGTLNPKFTITTIKSKIKEKQTYETLETDDELETGNYEDSFLQLIQKMRETINIESLAREIYSRFPDKEKLEQRKRDIKKQLVYK